MIWKMRKYRLQWFRKKIKFSRAWIHVFLMGQMLRCLKLGCITERKQRNKLVFTYDFHAQWQKNLGDDTVDQVTIYNYFCFATLAEVFRRDLVQGNHFLNARIFTLGLFSEKFRTVIKTYWVFKSTCGSIIKYFKKKNKKLSCRVLLV